MGHRAESSGISLSAEDAAIVKGMLPRGDRRHDIAAWFGVNAGPIGEIGTGLRFHDVAPADNSVLPPSGPYLSGRDARVALSALSAARKVLDQAETLLRKKSG